VHDTQRKPANLGDDGDSARDDRDRGPACPVATTPPNGCPGSARSQAGLVQFFSGHSSLLVSADVGSSDGTRGQVRTLVAENPLLRELGPADGAAGTTSPGVETREAAHDLLEQAHQVHARACLVLDASMTSMGADWVAQLARPILDDQFDMVVPYFARHKLDGAISKGIVYPLTRALYGKRVRQPLGSVFALSGRLVERFLGKEESGK